MLLGPHTGVRLPSRANTEDLVVVIETPDRQLHQPDRVDLRDHKISIRYTPLQVGTHLIDIFYQGSRIKGSPFQFFVDSDGLRRNGGLDMGFRVNQHHEGMSATSSSNSSSMMYNQAGDGSYDFGRHVVDGRLAFSRQVSPVSEVGVCNQLKIRSADGGDLDKSMLVAFDGPEKVDVDLEERSRREYQLSYTFFAPGDYQMRVLVGGSDILNPIPVHVVGDAIGASSSGSFFSNSGVFNSAANGSANNAASSSSAWFSSARHLNLGESSFATEQALLSHRVYGEGIERGWSGRECTFEVQLPTQTTSENGPLTVTIDGPSKVDLLYDEVAYNVFRFRYTPLLPGEYFVAIKLGPEMRHILASPYKVIVH